MHLSLRVILLAFVAFAAGCASTPQDRISGHREAFGRFPLEVQRKISAGEVDIGFTVEMVEMALGPAGRKFARADATGESEVWVYYQRRPRFGFGFGVSSGGYGGVSTGVSMSTAHDPDDEVMRVVFHDGKVTSIEHVR